VPSVSGSPINFTPTIIANQMIGNVTNQEAQQAALEIQLSTGNLVNSPSDNPAAAAQIINLNDGLARAAQYQSNAADGLGWLSLGNTTLNSAVSTLQTVLQAAQSVSGVAIAGNPQALQAVASQISSARQQLIQLANTTYDGQAIFAGTGNLTAAYDANGNYVGGGSAPTRTVG